MQLPSRLQGQEILLVINFEGRLVPFTENDLAFKITTGNYQGKKTSVYALCPTSSCISFVRHNNMSFHCHEMSLQWFFTVNSPVIFLKYIFEFVFNSAGSASKGVCRWNCHGKGLKLKAFHQTYIIILSSVLVTLRSRVKLKMPGSNRS